MSDTEQKKPVDTNPETMSLDDLKAIIDRGETAPAPVPDTETEPSEEEETESEEVEAKEDDSEETQTESEPEPATEEQDDTDPNIRELRLQLEETEKRVKHFERTAGRAAGEKGFLEQKIRGYEDEINGLRDEISRLKGEDAGEEVERPAARSRRERRPRASDNGDAEIMQRLLRQEMAEFMRENPGALDESGNDLAADFKDAVNRLDVGHILEAEPLDAARQMRAKLDDAWYRVDLERTIAKRKQEAERKTVDSAKSLKDKKRAARITASGGAPAESPRKPLDPWEMPMDDLKKLIERVNKE